MAKASKREVSPSAWVTGPDDENYWDWRIKLTLPLLGSPGIRGKYMDPPGRAIRREKLAGVGGFGPAVSAPQDAAVRWLVDHEALALELVLAAVARFARELRAGGGWEHCDDPPGLDVLMPRGMTAAQAAERVTVADVGVSRRARDGQAYLEVRGECAWDPDHGFEVVLHADRVVGTYQQGTGWVDKLPGGRRTK